MYTGIRKILYLPKFFAFFSIKIDSLTFKVMTTRISLICPNFLTFSALKLIHILWQSWLPPILPNFFAFLALKLIHSLTYFESHDYSLFCPNFLPFSTLRLIHSLWQSWLPPILPIFFAFLALKLIHLLN